MDRYLLDDDSVSVEVFRVDGTDTGKGDGLHSQGLHLFRFFIEVFRQTSLKDDVVVVDALLHHELHLIGEVTVDGPAVFQEHIAGLSDIGGVIRFFRCGFAEVVDMGDLQRREEVIDLLIAFRIFKVDFKESFSDFCRDISYGRIGNAVQFKDEDSIRLGIAGFAVREGQDIAHDLCVIDILDRFSFIAGDSHEDSDEFGLLINSDGDRLISGIVFTIPLPLDELPALFGRAAGDRHLSAFRDIGSIGLDRVLFFKDRVPFSFLGDSDLAETFDID